MAWRPALRHYGWGLDCPLEETIVAFAEGRLSAEALGRVESHVPTCARCEDVLLAASAAADASRSTVHEVRSGLDARLSLKRGATVGGYTILSLIGRGGMGEVYVAYDPDLDRKVAIKLLRPSLAEAAEGRVRMLREAQALAKLQHPNVVVVYGVGLLDESVFLAMEFIDGMTAASWLRAERRGWRDVLRVFLAAGRGLAAAHDAGMIHRDFKLENLMITRDGQVRVMDFGLARAVASDRADDGIELNATAILTETDDDGPVAASPLLHASLTRTGAQVGTRLYMAPEQFSPGQRLDARSDQFSFCVSLYEALYGERPFEAPDLSTLKQNLFANTVRPPPPHKHVPPWIRRLLLRGLQPLPEARFPSMTALLATLEADPGQRRRRWAAVAASVAIAIGLAVVANRVGNGARTLCAGADARLAGIWEPGAGASPRKLAIRRAFTATGQPYAESAFVGASRLLDEYVARWQGMYRDACEATHVRGEQSAEILDLRMSCLGERLGGVRALTDLFANANASTVENAVTAAGALQAFDGCADVKLLRALVIPPEDAAQRRRVDDLRDELARFVALRDAGQCLAADKKAQPLIDAARSVAYEPLLAETLFAAAQLFMACADPDLSARRYREAYWAALGSRHDLVAAQAALMLSGLASNRLGKLDMAREWLASGRAMVQRMGGADLLQARVDLSEAFILEAGGQYDGALTSLTRAIDIKERVLGPDHPESLMSRGDRGNFLLSAGRAAEALKADQRASLDDARVFGPNHPWVGFAINNEGEALNALGRHGEAAEAFQRAQSILRQAGATPLVLSHPLTGLGIALLGLARDDDAVAPLEDAYRIRRDQAPDAVEACEVEFALARALWHRADDRERARGLAVTARAGYYSRPRDAAALAKVDAWLVSHTL